MGLSFVLPLDMLAGVKARLPILALLAFGLAAMPRWAGAQSGLLSGRVINQTAACGPAEALTVQISGTDMSPRFDVPPDKSPALALPRGLYGVAVLRADGSLLEETNTLVASPDFVLAVGCAGIPRPLEFPKEGTAAPVVPVRLVNTSGDCGDPRTVEFLVDRRFVGSVPDKGETRALVPEPGAIVDVLSAGRRLLTYSVSRPKAGQTLAFGCTFPDAAGVREGVPVAFENTTDQCPEATARRALTLWVDGLPVTGLAAGLKTAVRVAPGRHEFEVRVGWSRERVVRGAKDVAAPFRIHYGCGK